MSLQELDRMRPTFERSIALPPDTVRELFANNVDRGVCGCHVRMASRHVDIAVADENRKLYSPVLSLELQEQGQGTRVCGRYQPAPVLWTFHMFLYAMTTFGAVSSLVGGVSLSILQQPAWPFWGLPIAALLASAIYMSAQVGQQLGRSQMLCLNEFVESALEGAPLLPVDADSTP